MRLGLMISAGLVLIAAAVVGYNIMPRAADPPTAATAARHLQAVTLPASLPKWTYEPTSDAKAGDLYRQAVELYLDHRHALEASQPPDDLAARVSHLLVAAAHAQPAPLPGPHGTGVFDAYVQVAIPPDRTDGQAMSVLPGVALDHAKALAKRGKSEQAQEVTGAVWALGLELFRRNVWLKNRLAGLAAMRAAARQRYEMVGEIRAKRGSREASQTPSGGVDRKSIIAAADAIQYVMAAWRPKLRIVSSPEPQVGDLLNELHHDRDRTFRLAAALNLAVVKYASHGRGNAQAIGRAIAHAKASDDPLIAATGRAVDAIPRKQVRRMK